MRQIPLNFRIGATNSNGRLYGWDLALALLSARNQWMVFKTAADDADRPEPSVRDVVGMVDGISFANEGRVLFNVAPCGLNPELLEAATYITMSGAGDVADDGTVTGVRVFSLHLTESSAEVQN